MKRTALLGSSFNPPHNGHLMLAAGCADFLGAGRVLLIPAASPPHKSAAEYAPAADRLAMCRLAARCDPRFEASDIELRRGGVSYTVDTLEALRRESPQEELFFLMGADMFLSFHTWKDTERILELCRICAVPRGAADEAAMLGYARQKNIPKDRFLIKNLPLVNISSSQIRQNIKSGLSVAGLVPEAVNQYILEKGLYRSPSGIGAAEHHVL